MQQDYEKKAVIYSDCLLFFRKAILLLFRSEYFIIFILNRYHDILKYLYIFAFVPANFRN